MLLSHYGKGLNELQREKSAFEIHPLRAHNICEIYVKMSNTLHKCAKHEVDDL
eukprot:CAMPEP_0172841122 /NCGR_PEP_ID=MMETSP1075-20121228/29801_1 /TAXON_ID=2916 /ORGANISM="Ceratium fusus, Strain PA161109" /LENGTH=52 /DNA_ID=CAMNT_0013685067 /DNA_START=1 /DNA_END=159 /DNA_ORIENTATION=-